MFEFSNIEIKKFKLLVGKNVKKIRESKGISQLDLGLDIGHNSATLISKAEIGLHDKHFNLEHLYKISKVLDVDICEFFKPT